ncbi:MAG: phosphopantetheine-binding protein [Polyangiaceae bacterium]|jgi:acyl carrier protein|nr:phosphopantetheine-binding protein [Polyangiaceae bacterium]
MSASYVVEVKELLIRALDLQGRTAADIDEEAPLFGEGLGLDSLDALQIAMAVEEEFGVAIPEGEEAKPLFRNVASLAAYVAAKRSETA